jgi:two-component system nitrogen regulation sensor histidine kinase GlnL
MSEERSPKRLLESLSTAILLCDTDLRLVYVNPAAESLLGISHSRALGLPLTQVLIEFENNAGAALAETLRSGHQFTKREARLRVGLRDITVDYTVSLFTEAAAKPELLIEIQPRERLLKIAREEAMLASHQAMRQLVRGVAHEIKNPLGGIRGAAQLLERELPDAELKEYTRVIIEEADRLRVLADRMLGPRRLPTLRRVNPHECVERVVALLEAEADGRISIVRDYDPSLPDIEADPDQLIQAMLNIGGNALQALLENPSSRHPTLLFKTRPMRQFTIGAKRHRLVLRIDIEDNGPGIPTELKQSIFYPMVSGRAAGNGLGLSIAQDIIHQYHGLIECDSYSGRTLFSIYLPLDKPHD